MDDNKSMPGSRLSTTGVVALSNDRKLTGSTASRHALTG